MALSTRFSRPFCSIMNRYYERRRQATGNPKSRSALSIHPITMAEGSSASTPAVVPAIEDHFVPSTRLQRIVGDELYEVLQSWCTFEEVELTERGQEMLRNGEGQRTNLCLSLLNMITWLGEGIVVDGTGRGDLIEEFKCYGSNIVAKLEITTVVDGLNGPLTILVSPETTQATLTAVCDPLLLGLAEIKSVAMEADNFVHTLDYSACPFSGPGFSRFLTQSSDIPGLEIMSFDLDVEHCRALGDTENSREDFEIKLIDCRLTEAGERVLFDGIRRNRGPTSLIMCPFNTRSLAEALNGNSRIKVCCIGSFGNRNTKRKIGEDVLFLLGALSKNLGIKELNLSTLSITDESWGVMCQSLANHPAIEQLNLWYTASHDESSLGTNMSEARKTHRTQSLAEMLKVNTTISKIHLGSNECDDIIWQNEIKPQLEINKFRLRVAAVKKTQGTLRAPLFGRAVHAVNDNDSYIFMMVKGNVDLFAEIFHGRTRPARKRTRYGK